MRYMNLNIYSKLDRLTIYKSDNAAALRQTGHSSKFLGWLKNSYETHYVSVF